MEYPEEEAWNAEVEAAWDSVQERPTEWLISQGLMVPSHELDLILESLLV